MAAIALAKLNGRKDHLIISDVNMPNMDGITFVKAMRTLSSTSSRRSSCSPPAYQVHARAGAEAGCQGVGCLKPFDKPPNVGRWLARFALRSGGCCG